MLFILEVLFYILLIFIGMKILIQLKTWIQFNVGIMRNVKFLETNLNESLTKRTDNGVEINYNGVNYKFSITASNDFPLVYHKVYSIDGVLTKDYNEVLFIRKLMNWYKKFEFNKRINT